MPGRPLAVLSRPHFFSHKLVHRNGERIGHIKEGVRKDGEKGNKGVTGDNMEEGKTREGEKENRGR